MKQVVVWGLRGRKRCKKRKLEKNNSKEEQLKAKQKKKKKKARRTKIYFAFDNFCFLNDGNNDGDDDITDNNSG